MHVPLVGSLLTSYRSAAASAVPAVLVVEEGKSRMASSEAARGTDTLSSPMGIFHAEGEGGDWTGL